MFMINNYMLIWYVHGAGASKRSFNWLSKQLPKHQAKFLSYRTNESVSSVANRFLQMIDEPCILIGHSLGGIITTVCADNPNVQKLITICAPFGGVRHAEIMSMFSLEPLFYDLRSQGPTLINARNKYISKPHMAIVGTSGLPFSSESNDGVLTVDSQMAKDDTDYTMFELNHFEVLLSLEVVTVIAAFLQ